MAYRQPNGKNTRMTFGAYPEVTLLDACQKRMDAKKQKAARTDPAQAKRWGAALGALAADHRDPIRQIESQSVRRA